MRAELSPLKFVTPAKAGVHLVKVRLANAGDGFPPSRE
jgi:hypothetical protein